MKAKQISRIKKTVDAGMTVLLLCLTAYQVTGETLHEWFGVGMTALLIAHHILNRKWYASLFKGKYNAYRTVTVIVNTLLLASIALTALCGMAMSAHAVPFLYGILPVSFARQFHLAMSYWSFLLMGLHLGLHVPAMTAALKWSETGKTALATAAAVIAGFGFRFFIKNRFPDYIFFRAPFASFDYDKNGVLVFAEHLTILLAFAFLGGSIAAILKAHRNKDADKRKRWIPAVLVLISLLIAAALCLFPESNPHSAPWQDTPKPQPEPSSAAGIPTTPAADGDGFVLLPGGTFLMGSPETENWRISDETQHEMRVSPFYIDPYEATQADYARVTGQDPSAFHGADLFEITLVNPYSTDYNTVLMEAQEDQHTGARPEIRDLPADAAADSDKA